MTIYLQSEGLRKKVLLDIIRARIHQCCQENKEGCWDVNVTKLTVKFKGADFEVIDTKLKNHMTTINTAIGNKYQEILTELNNKAEADVKRYKKSGIWLDPHVWIIYTNLFLCGVIYVWWTALNTILG